MDVAHNPADIPAPASYHWTPALQREFLEHLAATGSVKLAAQRVSMSTGAVYQLRQRPEGAAFKLGCGAAVLIARARLADELLDRAIWGHEETAELMREDGRSYAKRRRLDARLGLAMLARLDRMAETRAQAGEEMLAQIIAGDWPGFLSLFDAAAAVHDAERTEDQPDRHPEGLAAALALWLAARDDRANPLAAPGQDDPNASEVSEFSADFDGDREDAETPEQAAAAMTVWFDDRAGDWRTDFPPPEGFYGHEEGQFGDAAYARALDDDELDLYALLRDAQATPLRLAGEAARRAFFGLPEPANDPAPDCGLKARKGASG